jgi:hypothetical protein
MMKIAILDDYQNVALELADWSPVAEREATEFRYEREAQPLPKIGPWTDQLDELLLANEGKAARPSAASTALSSP